LIVFDSTLLVNQYFVRLPFPVKYRTNGILLLL
jgi:hypothetical protein